MPSFLSVSLCLFLYFPITYSLLFSMYTHTHTHCWRTNNLHYLQDAVSPTTSHNILLDGWLTVGRTAAHRLSSQLRLWAGSWEMEKREDWISGSLWLAVSPDHSLPPWHFLALCTWMQTEPRCSLCIWAYPDSLWSSSWFAPILS